MKLVKKGTCWSGASGKVFTVIDVVELEGNTWVYYRDHMTEEGEEVKEYSCYEESFLERFHGLPECPK